MKILITNDDGIFAKGIFYLAQQLEKDHDVIIVAPSEERSASSHSITLRNDLIVREEKLEGIKSKAYSITGTPADCTKFALTNIDSEIELVISGINNGFNLGTDVLYSGTVSAAMEGLIMKKTAIAFSCDGIEENYVKTAKLAAKIVKKFIENEFDAKVMFNINFPSKLKSNDIKVCKMGYRDYKNTYIETLNEDGSRTAKIYGEPIKKCEKDTDIYNIEAGYITITPLQYQLTHFESIDLVKNILM